MSNPPESKKTEVPMILSLPLIVFNGEKPKTEMLIIHAIKNVKGFYVQMSYETWAALNRGREREPLNNRALTQDGFIAGMKIVIDEKLGFNEHLFSRIDIVMLAMDQFPQMQGYLQGVDAEMVNNWEIDPDDGLVKFLTIQWSCDRFRVLFRNRWELYAVAQRDKPIESGVYPEVQK